MRTPLSYSSLPHRARPIPLTFCTGGHAQSSIYAPQPPRADPAGSRKPKTGSRKPKALSQTLSKLPAPTVVPASTLPPPVRNPVAASRSIPLPLPTPRSHVPASAETPAAARSALPAIRPWLHDPAEFSPALPPSAFPAWHRSAITGPAEINPIPHAAPAAPATL